MPDCSELDIDVAVLGAVAIQRAARLALLSKREEAKQVLLATRHRLVSLSEATQRVCLLVMLGAWASHEEVVGGVL